jgi:CDP-diglyceride synthetase
MDSQGPDQPKFVWTVDNFNAERRNFRKVIQSEATPIRDKRLRFWLNQSLAADSRYTRLYRILGQDIDDDLAWAATIGTGKGATIFSDEENHYWQRLIWRNLMRNYSWRRAWQVGTLMSTYESYKADILWKLQRLISYSYPRLLVASAVGLLAILGSSSLQDLLHATTKPQPWTALLLVAAYLLCTSEVARRVGRRPKPVLLRSSLLFLLGGAYSACLALLVPPPCSPTAQTAPWYLLAATILLLAFVTQLFWHDRPVSEPL